MTTNYSKTISEQTKANFAKELKVALYKKYNKKVSVVFFVNQFNLRSHDTNPIAYETARKWLHGKTLPELSKIKLLTSWLNLDTQKLFFKTENNAVVSTYLTKTSQNVTDEKSDNTILLDQITSVISKLDTEHQGLLLITAILLKEFSTKNDPGFLYNSFVDILKTVINTE